MRTRICYEWDLETTDLDGDVLDHDHCDTAIELLTRYRQYGDPPPGEKYRIVLVRDERESWDGEPGSLIDRNWAYIDEENGQLPECFSAPGISGMVTLTYMRVPKKFHTELKRAMA